MINKKSFEELVLKYKQANLNINYLLVNQQEATFIYDFKKNHKLSDIRSISKTVMALVAGIVFDQYPDFDENTYVYPILKNSIKITNKANITYLKQIKIKHLLNHTIGYEDVLLMRNDIVNIKLDQLLDYVVNYPIKNQPGIYYLYSNAGYYLLSVVLDIIVGGNLEQFIVDNLFSKIKINSYKWEYYGKYLAGATRLYLFPEDLLKIAQLIMENDGSTVSKHWIKFMKEKSFNTKHHHTNDWLSRYAYGHSLWLNKVGDIVFGHGTDSQIMLLIKELDLILIMMADESNNSISERIINDFLLLMK